MQAVIIDGKELMNVWGIEIMVFEPKVEQYIATTLEEGVTSIAEDSAAFGDLIVLEEEPK